MQWLALCLHRRRESSRRPRSDQYAYQIAEIQQKTHKRASSVSSSENFSSSRSDSWRQSHHHHCGIPLRLLDPKRRANSWLVTRKTSQDSNLSSSRNDSSGSATTQSTSTWRMSRSSASSDLRTQIIPNADANTNKPRTKPRLTRQSAISDDTEFQVPPGSPGRLTVRFLTTIPSAAETSMQNEDEVSQESTMEKHTIFNPDESEKNRDEKRPLSRENSDERSRSKNLAPSTNLPSCPSTQKTSFGPSAVGPSSLLFHVPNLLSDSSALPIIRSAPSLSTPVDFFSPLHSSDKNLVEQDFHERQ